HRDRATRGKAAGSQHGGPGRPASRPQRAARDPAAIRLNSSSNSASQPVRVYPAVSGHSQIFLNCHELSCPVTARAATDKTRLITGRYGHPSRTVSLQTVTRRVDRGVRTWRTAATLRDRPGSLPWRAQPPIWAVPPV